MFGGGRPVQYQQADHPYMPTLANTCGKCAKPNWPTHDTRAVPDANGCLVRWTSDLLPHEAAPTIAGMQRQGLSVLKKTLESS